LPTLEPGQVFNGEITITNYGLIAADYSGISFPSSFDDYDLEVLAKFPTSLGANQKVVVPYRITRRQQTAATTIGEELPSYGGSCSGSASISSTWTQPICPNSPNGRTKTSTSTSTIYWNTCPPSASKGGGGGGSSYTGGSGGSGGGQGSGGGWGGIGSAPTVLGDGDECGSDIPRCDAKDPNCCKVCTNSLVNLGSGTYEDSQTDIDIKTNGIPVSFERAYASRWTHIGAPPAQMFVQSITFGCGGPSNASNVSSKHSCGGVFVHVSNPTFQAPQKFGWTSPWFAKVNDFTNYIAYFDGEGQIVYFNKGIDFSYSPAKGAEKYTESLGLQAIKTATGFRILDKTGIRKNFDRVRADSWYVLTSIEDTHGKRITFGYDADENLVSVDDATGNRVATLTYTNGMLSKLTDRDGREVNYKVDDLGRLVEVNGPQGEKSTFVFDQVKQFNRLLRKTDPEGNVTTIDYLPGQLTVSKVTEPGGGTRTFGYDFKGYTFNTTDPRGITTVYKVNTDGKMTSVTKNGVVIKKIDYPNDRTEVTTDEVGNTTRIQRNEKYDPIAITDGEGNTTRIEYNGYWKLAKVTDPLGNVATFDYNEKQDLTTVTDPEGKKTLFEYDPFGNVTKITKGEGEKASVNQYEYDSRGNLTKAIDPLGNITTLGYDVYGHVNKITDANNNTTTITNDSIGRPLTAEDPLGNKKTFSYDKKGNAVTFTNELNRTSRFTYDFKGRVTSATDPLGNATTYTYDGEGNLVEKKSLAGTANEKTSTFVYDFQNRLQSATDPMGNTTSYDYTGATAGPAKITNPLGNITRNLYNRTGNLSSVVDPLNNVTNIIRDVKGHPTRITDANGNSTTYVYDVLGRVTSQINAEGGVTRFVYDTSGELETLTGPNNNTTTFKYDLAGRKTKETRPMGQIREFSYYPNGTIKAVKDAKNQITTYTYDAASRVTEISYADGKKDTFQYDAAGNMTSYAKEAVSGSIVYDELNRKIEETVNYGAFTKKYSYTYDASGNKASFISPEGRQYSYTYNKNNYPTQIAFDGKSINLDYQWNRLTKVTLPNGTSNEYQYNANSWLSYITTRNATSTIANSQFTFDNVGNITGRTGDAPISYGYDKTYQLTSAGTESFSYDKAGNRTNSGYIHNANNELTKTDAASYTLDANGNTITKTAIGQTTSYTYNSANRLEEVHLPDGRTATYTYDPFGRRIKKQVGNDVTYYLYADEGLIGEYAADGTNKKAYGWMPDSLWGTNPLFQVDNGNYYYYHNDHLGMPQKMTDGTGTVVWSATYTAFGQATVDTSSTITNNLRMPGQYYDEETNLHYNWNRYYDPEIGRYTQVDPANFSGGDANLYRYVGNNAQNRLDPYGLWDPDWREVGKGALKAGVVIAGVAVVIATAPVSIPAAAVTGLAVVGTGLLILETGQVITGKKISIGRGGITVCQMDDKQRSEMLGEVIVGWATMGLAGVKGSKGAKAPKVEPVEEGGLCFTENTPVLTEKGQKPIQQVKADDLVYSRNAETGESGLKKVKRAFVRETHTLVILEISGTKIETTPDHPFYVVGRGWTKAGWLKAGDVLTLYSGKQVRVSSVATKWLEKPVTVYNFEVEDWHSYFVSSENVLVHNNCAAEPVKLTRGGQKQIGNMSDYKDMSAADAIKARGGGAGQVKQLQTGYESKSVGELANLAAQGDPKAVTAMKIIKQAASKAEKYGNN